MKTHEPRESNQGRHHILLTNFRCLPLLFLAVIGPLFALPAVAGHKVQVSDAALAQQVANQGGRLLADYGGYRLYEVAEVLPNTAGSSDLEVRDDYNQIWLNAAPIDTTTAAATALRSSLGSFAGKRMHLVQFVGPVKPEWHEALMRTGVQIVSYIPENAYLVYGDAKALTQLQQMARVAPHVQWDGQYLDYYRIHPQARPVDEQGLPRQIGTDLFAIQLVADTEANAATLQLIDQLKLEPISDQSLALGFLNLVAKLDPASVITLATQPDVVSIQPHFKPKLRDERQDQICAGNLTGDAPSGPGYLNWLNGRGFTQAQFDANPFAVDVTDSGIDNGTTTPIHPDLYVQGATSNPSRVIYNRLEGKPNTGSTLQGCDGHGTINSHIIGGFNDLTGSPHTDASGYHYGLGVCPFVRLGSSVIFDPNNYTYPNLETLQSAAYADGARVSGNSWGADSGGAYTSSSQRYDALVRDAQSSTNGNQEMVIVFAAGNAGPSSKTVGSPGSAKNVITVGASENVQPFGAADGCGLADTGADSANDIIGFSSRGPCSDSRKKPDIVAPGTHVSGGAPQVTCFDGSGVCGGVDGDIYYPSGQTLYTASSGTSHSTPAVAGGCALLRQYFINRGSNAPSPAMTKACLMNSARYLTGVSAKDTLWSTSQGMGGMNLGMAFDGTPGLLLDQLPTDKFTASGQTRTFTGTVTDSSKPFRVTVAWTDAPGSTTGNAYNNNLDLTVTIGGKTYLGNVFSGAISVTGGSADARNNVESVFLPAGTSGDFAVTVVGVNINSDGVPHDSDPLDQDFALVIYNAVILGPPSANFSASPTKGAVPLAVAFADTSTGFITNRSWDFGDGTITSTTATNVPHTYTNAGVYSPSLTVFGPIGSSTTNRLNSIVVTNPPPVAHFVGNPTSGLAPLRVLFANTTTGLATNEDWNFGDGGLLTTNASAVSHTYVNAGTYSVNLTARGPGGTSSANKANYIVVTNGPPVASFVASLTNGPAPLLVIFTNNSLGMVTTALWSLGDGNTNNTLDPTLANTYALAGTYTVSLTVSGPFGTGTSSSFIVVTNAAPEPAFAADRLLGPWPLAVTFTNLSSYATNYTWIFGDGTTNSTTSTNVLSHTYDTAGNYAVCLTATGLGGTRTLCSNNLIVVTNPPLNVAAYGDSSSGQGNLPTRAIDAIAIAAGAWHNLALVDNSTILAWGDDSYGQCDVPPTLKDTVAIAAGGYHSLAIRLNGTVLAWGAGDYGQTSVPARLAGVIGIAAGTWHSVALRTDGTVVVWGDNSYGQTNQPAGLTNVTAVAAGGNHTLALKANGTVVAWGENTDAEGYVAGQSVVPWGLTNVVAIGAGEYHSLAVKADGTVVTWGDDSQGQSDVPSGLANVVAVAGGGGHSVALRADGTVATWGANWNGQCSLDTTLSGAAGIAAGEYHTLVLLASNMPPPRLLNPARNGSTFSTLVQTLSGKTYALEFTSSLAAANWTGVCTNAGNGALKVLTDPTATSTQRFYRLRQW